MVLSWTEISSFLKEYCMCCRIYFVDSVFLEIHVFNLSRKLWKGIKVWNTFSFSCLGVEVMFVIVLFSGNYKN